MCVIVYKPAGVEFPDEKLLMNCFERNSDGAGYMYAHKGRVFIRKGLMTYKGFADSLDDLDPRVDRTKSPFVFHFRISTQAGVRKDCCHPYPLSKNMDDLRKLKSEADIGIAHNGIIDLTSEYTYKGKTQPTYNDTMKFITDYLTLIIQDRHYYKNRDTVTLIEKLAGSKLAILDGAGHCELIGKFEKKDGCWYSNDSYKGWSAYKKYYSKPYSYNWDDYDYIYGSNKKDDKEKRWFDEQEIEYWFDERSGLYYFDDYNCPAYVDGDPSYCKHCNSRAWCERQKPEPIYEPVKIAGKVDGKDLPEAF